ncbi:hypothetical protein BH09SUM1_BH09SUM1_11470 [soil metagenome]
MSVPHFRLPLDLPHAGTIAFRIVELLERKYSQREDAELLLAVAQRLHQLLEPYRKDGENPGDEEGKRVAADAARLARGIVGYIEKLKIGEDRLGQHIRNLFECLALGEEGATISLKAGEDPKSPQRPA